MARVLDSDGLATRILSLDVANARQPLEPIVVSGDSDADPFGIAMRTPLQERTVPPALEYNPDLQINEHVVKDPEGPAISAGPTFEEPTAYVTFAGWYLQLDTRTDKFYP